MPLQPKKPTFVDGSVTQEGGNGPPFGGGGQSLSARQKSAPERQASPTLVQHPLLYGVNPHSLLAQSASVWHVETLAQRDHANELTVKN
jgi:hypothetical protein